MLLRAFVFLAPLAAALLVGCTSDETAAAKPKKHTTTGAGGGASGAGGAGDQGAGGAAGASGSSVVAIDLGTIDRGASVSFEVPAGTLGFNLVGRVEVPFDSKLGIRTLTSPSHGPVLEDFTPVGGTGETARAEADLTAASAP